MAEVIGPTPIECIGFNQLGDVPQLVADERTAVCLIAARPADKERDIHVAHVASQSEGENLNSCVRHIAQDFKGHQRCLVEHIAQIGPEGQPGLVAVGDLPIDDTEGDDNLS